MTQYPGEEIMVADALGTTKAQWWNGYLTTHSSSRATAKQKAELVERHERILLEMRESGRLDGAMPSLYNGISSFRACADMGMVWDRIPVHDEAAKEKAAADARAAAIQRELAKNLRTWGEAGANSQASDMLDAIRAILGCSCDS